MWSRFKTLQVVVCAFALTLGACGFHPMYGTAATEAGTTSALQGNIIIKMNGNGRYEQVMKASLEDHFNPEGLTNAKPDYTLEISIARTLIPSVVRSDGTILRYDVRFETPFKLINNTLKPTDKNAVYNGLVRRTSSYNVVPNANFATYEAEQNLNERMLREMAEDYVLRISGHLAGKQENETNHP